jgi:hypothetical protein
VHSVVCTPIIDQLSSEKLRRTAGPSCPGAPGTADVAQELRHPGQAFGRSGPLPGHRAFFFATRIEEAQKRPLPASGGAGAQLHPPKPPPRQLAVHIALGITWDGLVGGRGHRKGQPIAIARAKQPFRAPH